MPLLRRLAVSDSTATLATGGPASRAPQRQQGVRKRAFDGQMRPTANRRAAANQVSSSKDSSGSLPAGSVRSVGKQPLGLPLELKQPRQTPQHCQVRGVVHVEAEPAARRVHVDVTGRKDKRQCGESPQVAVDDVQRGEGADPQCERQPARPATVEPRQQADCQPGPPELDERAADDEYRGCTACCLPSLTTGTTKRSNSSWLSA